MLSKQSSFQGNHMLLTLLSLVPPTYVKSSNPEVVAIYHDDVTISCIVMSLTSDFEVTWSSSANISLPNATRVFRDDDKYESSLMFTSIGLDAIGVYTCTVWSSFGNNSVDIVVNVTGL